MKDVQSSRDFRNMPIEKVGIRNIRYPITVRDKSRQTQATVANVTLSVNLPHTSRGTHMSRLVEVLDRFKNEVSYQSLDLILIEIKKTLDAEESHIELAFPFFLRKKAPVSGQESLMSTTARSPPPIPVTWR
jgi:GTP cyclohydrolase I